jgi:hypothetical protein
MKIINEHDAITGDQIKAVLRCIARHARGDLDVELSLLTQALVYACKEANVDLTKLLLIVADAYKADPETVQMQ